MNQLVITMSAVNINHKSTLKQKAGGIQSSKARNATSQQVCVSYASFRMFLKKKETQDNQKSKIVLRV
jgi:hypothetical protein